MRTDEMIHRGEEWLQEEGNKIKEKFSDAELRARNAADEAAAKAKHRDQEVETDLDRL